jgi:hypothetical protein
VLKLAHDQGGGAPASPASYYPETVLTGDFGGTRLVRRRTIERAEEVGPGTPRETRS